MGRDVVELREMPDVSKVLVKALTGAVTKRGRKAELPNRSYLVMEHAQDVARLAEYCKVTGFSLRDEVPATWLHVQTFPMQAALMAEDDFPFSLAGLVHVSNTMTLHRAVRVGEKLRMVVRAENLQPHAKGAVFDMVGEIHAGDELVWRGSSNYLATGAKVPGEPGAALRLPAPDAPPSQQWRLAPDLGRQYAKVSGDSNPIHLYPLTAKLFGFPRPIIHGMWTHARALAALGGQLPEAYEVKVQFAKPILLPGKVGFTAVECDGAPSASQGTSDVSRRVPSVSRGTSEVSERVPSVSRGTSEVSERVPSVSRGTSEMYRGTSATFAVVNKEGKPHLVGELTGS